MRTLAVLFAASLLSLSSSAGAIGFSLDGSNCASCQGADISLDIVDRGRGFDVTLTINTDNYTGPRDGLAQIGFGGIRGWTRVTLVDSPSSSLIGWASPTAANINSSGQCNNGARSDKVCTSGYVDISGGGDFTWQFRVRGGRVATDLIDLHIGGQYANLSDLRRRRGPRGHIISESGPAIPEPSAAMLFGIGALLVARAPRKRR